MLLCGLLAVKLATPGVYEDEIQDTELFELDKASDRSLTEFLKNILLNDEDEPEEIDIADEKVLLLSSSSQDEIKYKNVVVYTGEFNNTEVRLVIPYSAYSSLSIIDNVLCNVGTSSVAGRILYGDDEIDPNDYTTYTYYMNPVYNSPSNVYRYGSYNYLREYYANNGSITYRDTYGKFYVNDVKVYYSVSERVYYTLLILLLFMGVSFIWNRK